MSTTNITKKLLNVAELAELLLTTTNNIYVLMCNGKIPHNCIIKLGKTVRFDKASIEEWLEGLKKTEPTQ